MKTLVSTLKMLCEAAGISGDETVAAKLALSYLKDFCPDARISHGNVIGTFGNPDADAPHILLDAHIDQIGMIVTDITDDGFVCVHNIGGIDRRLLPAQRVLLLGRKPLHGVVCSVPPHLSKGEDAVTKMEDIRIDTGYSAEELRKLLAPGDGVVFESCPVSLHNSNGTKITSPSLDDRSGVAAILHALSLLDKDLPCHVTVLFSTQEEVGERGAKIGCFAINPDIAIAVDVSFAGDGTDGTGIMGKGPMIGFAPSLSRDVSRELADVGDAERIPWQYEVMHGMTGTNADQFSVCREGVKACTVSIPLSYMHTPAEIVSTDDVMETSRLLAAYIRRCCAC